MPLRCAPRTCVLAVFCIFAGGTLLGLVHYVRATHDIVTESAWPRELKDLLAELRQDGTPVGTVDVRSVGLITTYCWSMPATDGTVAAHVKRFGLVPVSTAGVEVKRIHDRFPLAWSWPTLASAECFAFPPGLPGAEDGEFEYVLLRDKAAARLFFYYHFNF